MDLLLSGEQEELRKAVRALVEDRARVRASLDGETGYDTDLWRRLGRELGVLGLTVPEEYDGAGAGHTERAVVAEELGRALVPSPFLGSAVLTVDLLLALDDGAARADLLPALASGQTLGAVALDPGATATSRGGGWVLDGTLARVIDGAAADVLLVLAETGDGRAFFRVDGEISRTPLSTLDLTRRVARVDLDATPATRLDGDATHAVERVRDTAAVALGAEQVGGMGRAVELTVAYAKERRQFGRAIGSYQAVKHGCADMYATHELSSAVLRHACWVADHQPRDLPEAAALLAAYAGPGFFAVARSMVQYHGGIGYTWEHDAHLYYRRAKSDELLLGGSEVHRARIADRLGV